jgi:hypothetical protein
VPHNAEALMNFVILPPVRLTASGGFHFWPAADLPSNLEPSKTQTSAKAYEIAKIRDRCSTRPSATWQRPPPGGNVVDKAQSIPICSRTIAKRKLVLTAFLRAELAVPERPN